MKTFLKIGLGTLLLVVAALAVMHFYGASRMAAAPLVEPASVDILSDAAARERGRHLANAVAGCADCHRTDFGGRVMDDMPPNAKMVAPNLTSGRGGLGAAYTDADWVKGIAHGVGSDGRVLGIMPSEYYAQMSAYDLGALIGYLKTLPAVDSDLGATQIDFPATVIFGVLDFANMPVNKIDHDAVGRSNALAEVEYLLTMSGCVSCHGAKLAGVVSQMGPPPGPNLTTLDWTTEQFVQALRIGKRPDGTTMAVTMPWPTLGNMTEEEMRAIWDFVLAQPERTLGDND